LAQVAPVKGVDGFNRVAPVTGPSFVDATERGRKIRRGARLWTVAVATFKSETYRYLRLAAPTDEEIAADATVPPGFIHLPQGAEAEWIKQLVAEQLVTVTTRRGFQKLEWQKLRERNEALDCRVYARAAAWVVGADRWAEAKWRDLEDQLWRTPGQIDSNGARDETTPMTAGVLARAPRATGKRRSNWLVVDKGWLK
jgi:phage terminase large subunit GpA-like protein